MAKHEQPLALTGGEGRDAVLAEIGAERDRIRTEFIEAGAGVGRCAGADVTPFGIQENGNVRGDRVDGLAQQSQTRLPQGFVEGDVGLITADQVRGSLYHSAVPSQQRVTETIAPAIGLFAGSRPVGLILFRAGRRRRVQSDTKQRVVLARGRFQLGKK